MAKRQRGREEDTARSRMEALIAAMRRSKAEDSGDRIGAPEDDDWLAEVARRAVKRPVRDASGEGQQGEGVEEARHLERGAVVGRYMVLRELGAGGMGVVYAAYDPELDRKVALKVVAPGMMGEEGRTRLLREAQALAKLSHRNVVAIHDVGTMGEQVWLAMELLRGQTLREWLREPRDWREVLAVMRKAGRGLVAAHAAGLLHRDFKPENVMVGRKGGVKVMDFGLARARDEMDVLAAGDPEESVRGVVPVVDTLAIGVTQAGEMVGTPFYMAPEQLVGAELTAAADQFSLCVTLWEGLYGERPFGGGALEEIVGEMLAGRVREPAKKRTVPAWLRKVCERGLRLRAEERFASMEALLESLAKGRTRARVRKGLAAVGVAAVIGLGVEAYQRIDEARRVAACEASGDEIEVAWNEERRQALHDGIVGTGVSYAETTAEKVMPWLDRQAEAWREARIDACLDAEVHGRWDAETLDRSLWCLEERWMRLDSLVDELTLAEEDVVQKAVRAAVGLGSIQPCRDEPSLAVSARPPVRDREVIRDVRRDLTRVYNLELAGRYGKGLELARRALARAETLDYELLVAVARLRVGTLASKTSDYAEAELVLEEAYFTAVEVAAPEVAFEAALQLAYVVGVNLARHAEGLRWGRHARTILTGLPDGERLRRSSLLHSLASVQREAGEYEEAMDLSEQELEIVEDTLGPNHPSTASSLIGLAGVKKFTGAYEEAKALHERALSIWEKTLGPVHPQVALGANNLGVIHERMGNYREAKSYYERALWISEEAHGSLHPAVAGALNNLAAIHGAMGAYDEARALDERALGIWERVHDPGHPNVASSLHAIAIIHLTTGAPDKARPLFQRALEIRERALGPDHAHVATTLYSLVSTNIALGSYAEAQSLGERALAIQEKALGLEHPEVATTLLGLATIRFDTGDHEEARSLFARGLAIYEKALGPRHPIVAYALEGLARVALEQHRPTDAVTLAERAVAIREEAKVASQELADARFVLARALWEAPLGGGNDSTHATTLAEQARDAFQEAGKARTKELAEVEQWLADHRGDR